MSASAHASTDWLAILLSYWWLALLFGGSVVAFILDTFDAGFRALHRRSKIRHKRQLELKRIELQIAQAKTGVITSPVTGRKPGPCVHRNVVPVVADESVSAWLCRSCDAQLPADWAVREEDL